MFYCVFLCAKLCQGLVSGSGGVEKIPSVQRNVLAKRRLVQLVNNRAKLLALCSCILTHLRWSCLLVKITFLLFHFLRITIWMLETVACFSWRFSEDIIETCLFVIWRHLEFYILYCTPTDPKGSFLPGYRGQLSLILVFFKALSGLGCFWLRERLIYCFLCRSQWQQRFKRVKSEPARSWTGTLLHVPPPPMFFFLYWGIVCMGSEFVIFLRQIKVWILKDHVTLDWINGWWKFSSAIRGINYNFKILVSVREKLLCSFWVSLCVCV